MAESDRWPFEAACKTISNGPVAPNSQATKPFEIFPIDNNRGNSTIFFFHKVLTPKISYSIV